jgi:hypothetical protein
MSEGVLVVRLLEIEEVAVAAERLPLNRLAQPGGEYLVAWDGSEPVGHAHLDWPTTRNRLCALCRHRASCSEAWRQADRA